MRYAYYPGCSLHHSAREYDMSIRLVFQHLGIGLLEIEDWVCCGSTPAHMTNELLSVALPIENMLWAEERGMDIAMPCAACFSAMKTASVRMKEPEVKRRVEAILEARYDGRARVRHALQVVVNDYGLSRVEEKVRLRLKGLKATAYYGCLLTRPPKVKEFDDPENPQIMDHLLEAIGAEPVKWTHKTVCCGASFAATEPRIVWKLSYDILTKARKAGAECIVVACPLCHPNLDLNQAEIEAQYEESFDMPVFYFSQIMGIALGLEPRALGLDKNVVEPWKVLSRFIEVDIRAYR